MRSFKDIFSIKSALSKRNNFDLSCDTITTQNFFDPKVVYSREIVPNEHSNISVESFVRLSPLLYPTFMRCVSKSRCFFVPYRMIWRGFNNFITNTSSPTGQLYSNCLYFTNSDLVSVIKSPAFVDEVDKGNSDFTIRNNSTITNYKFTEPGRRVYDVLVGLGYRLCFDHQNNCFSSYFNGLPLLAYYKVMSDWYDVNQYSGFNRADSLINTIGFGHTISYNNLLQICNFLGSFTCNYDNDYFTSAFNRPNGPSGTQPAYSIQDQSSINGTDFLTVDNIDQTDMTPAIVDESENKLPVTQYIIDALKSLSDYVKRNQLSGSQVIDRYLSKFGVKLSSDKINKSIYIGSDEVPIQIGDIQSTNYTDTGDYPIGMLAGKGVGYGNQGHFTIDSDEFGICIIVSTIIPHVGYGQGVKRHTLHLSPLDYFNGEFDGLGNQAIAMKEVALTMDPENHFSWCSDEGGDSVFGYIPRYAEYKTALDTISGNFIYPSSNIGEDAWYGSRMFNSDRRTNNQRMQGDTTAGTTFLNSYADGNQYNRIFADEANGLLGNDHFRSIFHFSVQASLPMSKLFENYEFKDKGKEVNLKVGGSTLNN